MTIISHLPPAKARRLLKQLSRYPGTPIAIGEHRLAASKLGKFDKTLLVWEYDPDEAMQELLRLRKSAIQSSKDKEKGRE